MDETLVNRLLQLNRDFYERFAEAFSDTRGPQQEGLKRLLAYLPKQGTLLDVGCGNGRLAHVLDQAGLQVDYLGLDLRQGHLSAGRCPAARLDCRPGGAPV
jgi:2-polyprenyl-3-methyl-5-hydroxy-6-metoxy-1,4-benzoquinol methylase